MAEALFTTYGSDPWEKIATNQRTWYDPILRGVYRRDTVYANGLVPYATQQMLPTNATEMVFNQAFDFEPSPGEIPLRHTNIAPMGTDGQQVKINFTRYGATAAYDKYDAYITYWRNQGGGDGQSALAPLVSERIARHIQETTDLLIRNAFLNSPYIRLAGGASSAALLTQSNKFDLSYIDEAILRAKYQRVWTNLTNGTGGRTLMCIGSPGHEFDIVTGALNSRWIELQKYTTQTPFSQYEIGSYHNSRVFSTESNTLWNCGTIAKQCTLAASAGFKDGAPDPDSAKVDNTYYVGQHGTDSGNIKHYLQLSAFAAGEFAEGDLVTIHKRRVQAADVTAQPKLRVLNAPKFDDPDMVAYRRVVSVDAAADQIVLDRPLLKDFTVEVNSSGTGAAQPSSGVYGFVTRGLHLHVMIMIGAPDGVIGAVLIPPRFYGPMSIDLMQSYWQVGWDAYMKYQVIKPEAFEVVVTAGSSRIANTLTT